MFGNMCLPCLQRLFSWLSFWPPRFYISGRSFGRRYLSPQKFDRVGIGEANTMRQCDESRPICANCNISKRHCSYGDLVSKAYPLVQSPRSNIPSKSRAPQGTDKTPVNSPSGSSDVPGASDDSLPVNKLHLKLFHHLTSDILAFFGFEKLSAGFSTIEMTKVILAAPFLMNQILAHHAAQLQTHALSEFNSANIDITPDICVPVFLFSSILAMHMLCEKLVFRAGPFEGFLDDFIQSLRLHRGVRAVTNQFWHLLLQSPLKSLPEVEVEASPMDPATKEIYRQAVEDLQRAINGTRKHYTNLSAVGPILSWPVLIPDRYIDLLSERRPEALMWTFGDGGLYIISSVKRYLGPLWGDWLRWPNQIIDQPSMYD
ncbi:Zn(II)2Cys6 transcription factor domain-containing protein [Aspergillus undulatus]|uniref:Zn(II)2Cys6 transcription factor domain-containing protein n=1 Tax=Aspergillus undulatus TaxID=1810928 RepID=UPI003CCCD9B8